MSYEKQNWKNGDVITETKLNHMEDGIATGGGVFVVGGTIDGNTMTLDHTWQEIYDVGACLLRHADPDGGYSCALLISVYEEDGTYVCRFAYGQREMDFVADSADGYPSNTGESPK